MFKVNYKNTRTTSLSRSGVFIVNFEHISHLFLAFLLLILKKYILAGYLLTVSKFKFGTSCIQVYLPKNSTTLA